MNMEIYIWRKKKMMINLKNKIINLDEVLYIERLSNYAEVYFIRGKSCSISLEEYNYLKYCTYDIKK